MKGVQPRTQADRSAAELWDVIVIGAGPAGALAATLAARRGLRTLLVERKSPSESKACGGCFNQRAVAVLRHYGLQQTLSPPHAAELTRLHLRAWKKQVDVPLAGMLVASRAQFDERLRQAAQASGARLLMRTQAVCQRRQPDQDFAGTTEPLQSVQTNAVDDAGSTSAERHLAKVVIVADGLGHPSLKPFADVFTERVSRASRIGFAAQLPAPAEPYRLGQLWMGVSKQGYVGVVRLPDGSVNVAAAVARQAFLGNTAHDRVIQSMAMQAGLPELPVDRAAVWRGTPLLTRHTSPIALQRMFLVGDATGYVEPFTGEGIGNALYGAALLDSCLPLAMNDQLELARIQWVRLFHKQVWTRRRWCQVVAAVTRRPTVATALVQGLRVFPSLAQPVLRQVSACKPLPPVGQ